MSTNQDAFATTRKRRRQHSAHFKAELVSLCQQPGISIAAIALEHGLNANLLRRWITEHERDGKHALPQVESRSHHLAQHKEVSPANWISLDTQPVSLPGIDGHEAMMSHQANAGVAANPPVRLNLSGRGGLHVTLQWPSPDPHGLASFIRKLLA